MKARRSIVRVVVGGVAVVGVLAVGGPFVYIHFIEGKPPAPLRLADTPGAATTVAGASGSGAPETAVGTWKVTTGSQAGYRVNENLFGQNTTAVGRTSSITGTITVQDASVTQGSFSVDLTTVTSDRSQRDDQFQGRIMHTSSFPTATFTLTKPIDLGTLPADGVTVTKPAVGSLAMHGATRPVAFQVTAKKTGSTLAVSGSIPIVFADWGIPNPTFGPASTDDHGTLEFLLRFARA